MITVHINNQPHSLPDKLNIQELMGRLNVQIEGTAVALNNEVIPRSRHQIVTISDGDRLEVIRAVGGG